MASPVSAFLTPVPPLDAAYDRPEVIPVLASCGKVLLHEGCQVLGRNIFPSDSVPHVSRRHVKLDVRLQEVEVTVVGQNPAAIRNIGFPSLRLRPGQSALLRDGATLDFLPGRLRFRLSITGDAGNRAPDSSAHCGSRSVEQRGGAMAGSEHGGGHEGEGRGDHSIDTVAPREPQRTPRLIGPSLVQEMHLSPQPSGDGVAMIRDGPEGGSTMLGAGRHQPLPGGQAQLSDHSQHFPPPKRPDDEGDQLARDEEMVRRVQEEERGAGGAHSHHSREQLASDEALARVLQEQWGGVAREGDGRELGRAEPDRKRQRRSGGANVGEPSTPGRLPDEGGAQGTGGPGSFQLLQVHALPAWANRGCCRISDVIRGDVQWAVLTNYMIDLEWLLSACPVLYHVPRVILMHGEAGAALEGLQASKPANFLLHKPPLPISYGTHHSKAMLLVYRHGVRVVVHTANLIYIDWNNKTQGLWYQDFPLKTPDSPPSSPFERDLLDYLEALRWPGALVPSPDTNDEATRVTASFFRRFDFSRAAVRLVASVPGYHGGGRCESGGT